MQFDGLDVASVSHAADGFNDRLDRIKQSISGIRWYPYHSLSNIAHLGAILTGRRRFLRNLLGDGPILDIGCGDGDISFFLETLGCSLEAMDFGPTNYNGMAGVRALKNALHSSIDIREIDIDSKFSLPVDRSYTAAFVFGILYHLKNPFYFLEVLSRHVIYCFLSTRVARWTPGKRVSIGELPVAYLVGPSEVNQDKTNYWMFSPEGLRRLCERTNWDVCDLGFVGNTVDSDPVSSTGDERAFCLLRSRGIESFDPAVRFLKGWHSPVDGAWRWTEKDFSIEFDNYGSHRNLQIEIGFWVPAEAIQQIGAITVSARIEDCPLAPQVFTNPGMNAYRAEILASKEKLVMDFSIDKAFVPGGADLRRLGLAINRVEIL